MRQLRRAFGRPWCKLVRFAANLCATYFLDRYPPMTRSKLPKRFTISLDAQDDEELRMLAEAQRPPLPLQYVVRLAVLRLLDQPDSPLLPPRSENSR